MAQAGRPGWAGRTGDMHETFPLELRMQGRLAVVIGGSASAAGQVARLLAAGARVLVVAPELTGELADLAARGVIAARSRDYMAADLDGAWLVVCADDEMVNERAAADAAFRHIWCAGSGASTTVTALLPAADDPTAATLPRPHQPGH